MDSHKKLWVVTSVRTLRSDFRLTGETTSVIKAELDKLCALISPGRGRMDLISHPDGRGAQGIRKARKMMGWVRDKWGETGVLTSNDNLLVHLDVYNQIRHAVQASNTVAPSGPRILP